MQKNYIDSIKNDIKDYKNKADSKPDRFFFIKTIKQ